MSVYGVRVLYHQAQRAALWSLMQEMVNMFKQLNVGQHVRKVKQMSAGNVIIFTSSSPLSLKILNNNIF